MVGMPFSPMSMPGGSGGLTPYGGGGVPSMPGMGGMDPTMGMSTMGGMSPMGGMTGGFGALSSGDPQQSLGGMNMQLIGQILMMMSMMLQMLAQLLGGGMMGGGMMGGQPGGMPGLDGGGAPGGSIPGGGDTPTGGDIPTGGDTPTGGDIPTGGDTPTGGDIPTGGDTPTGGDIPGGGDTPTGGDIPTGGHSSGQPIQWDKAPPALAKYKNEIQAAAQKTGMPESLLAGMIWQESRGDMNAGSTNGGNGGHDAGLMQVNPETYKAELAGKNGLPQADATPTDPATNIMAGATYLAQMKAKFGSWDLAIRAYNSGPNGVDKSNPNAIPAGTGDPTYVTKVNQFAVNLEGGVQLPA